MQIAPKSDCLGDDVITAPCNQWKCDATCSPGESFTFAMYKDDEKNETIWYKTEDCTCGCRNCVGKGENRDMFGTRSTAISFLDVTISFTLVGNASVDVNPNVTDVVEAICADDVNLSAMTVKEMK